MTKMINFCTNYIQEMYKKGWKVYITKGTGHSEIVKEDKAIVLDSASPNFYKNSEKAKELVHQLWLQEQIKKAKQKYVSM